MGYENYDINLDDYRSDLDRLEKKVSEVSDKYLYIPKEPGVMFVRLLPPAPGERLFCSTRLHFINGRNYHCLRTLQGGFWRGECPICDEYNGLYDRAKRAKNDDEAAAFKATAKGIKPVEKNYWNAIGRKVYDPKTQETHVNVGPRIIPLNKTLQGKVLKAIFGDEKLQEPPLGNITHPAKGRDLKICMVIRKSPDGNFPNYEESKFMDVSPLGTPDQINEWLGSLHNLRSLRDDNLKSWEELKHQVDIFTGKVKDDSVSFTPNTPVDNDEVFVVTKPTSAKVSDSEDLSVPEDDFIRELQATLGK
jgi:hypothetical protein